MIELATRHGKWQGHGIKNHRQSYEGSRTKRSSRLPARHKSATVSEETATPLAGLLKDNKPFLYHFRALRYSYCT